MSRSKSYRGLDDGIELDWATYAGLMMIFLGIISVATAATSLIPQTILNKLLSPYIPEWAFASLSNIGTGLIAAGILAFTLERASRRRHQIDVAEIKSAHAESILKELMPQPIFEEVKAHIIQQPFLRTNCHGIIQLSWLDETKKYLSMSDVFSYEVENTSRTIEEYEIRVFEEKMNVDEFPGCTQIQEIKVINATSGPSEYTGTKLKDYMTITDQFIEAKILKRLQPGQKMKITAHVKGIRAARDVNAYIMVKPSINLILTVMHPLDLIVREVHLHASGHAFVIEADTPTLKIWRIDAGILPFQGVEVSWSPSRNEVAVRP